MARYRTLRRGRRKAGESFLFIFGKHYVARQAQHLEELHCLVVYVGEHDERAILFRDVDYAEQDGDTDAVDELRVAEIDYQRAGAGIELLLTFPLDSFASELV